MTNQLFNYWIRDLGLSLKFNKIMPFEKLSDGEKLFASVMRGDLVTFKQLLKNASGEDILQWENLVLDTGFARATVARLMDGDIFDVVPEATRKFLMRIAKQEVFDSNVSDIAFSELLALLADFTKQIVWIKGTALSRNLYKKNNFRSSGDFDVVILSTEFSNLIQVLQASGFRSLETPSFCNQLGVGPATQLTDLSLSPSARLIASSALAMRQGERPPLDIKLGPFDSGIQMREIDRFFQSAIVCTHENQTYLIPSLPDHLMISLHNFAKDRFLDWKNLYDIHLLAEQLNENKEQWQDFSDYCRIESLEAIAWAGLVLSKDRYGTFVPDSVLAALNARSTFFDKYFTFTVSPYFVWNATSLPMLILNAVTSSNCKEKLDLLKQAFLPPKYFLSSYYRNNAPLNRVTQTLCLVAHWLVLVLPGGVVRRTIGKFLWRNPTYSSK